MSDYVSGSAKPLGGGRMEVFQWYWFRLSGVVLTLLVFFHLWYNHIHTEVGELSRSLVLQRLSDYPILRVVDIVMLALGLSHGLLGIKNIIDDHATTPGRRTFWLSVLFILFAVFFAAGTAVMWTLEGSA